jgi:flagellar hook-basal body complex protein FliE
MLDITAVARQALTQHAAPLTSRDIEFPHAPVPAAGIKGLEAPAAAANGITAAQPFENVLGRVVSDVNDKLQAAEVEKKKVVLGESDNLHQAMLAIGEASVAFSFLVEARNKMVESYQEIMRMQV